MSPIARQILLLGSCQAIWVLTMAFGRSTSRNPVIPSFSLIETPICIVQRLDHGSWSRSSKIPSRMSGINQMPRIASDPDHCRSRCENQPLIRNLAGLNRTCRGVPATTESCLNSLMLCFVFLASIRIKNCAEDGLGFVLASAMPVRMSRTPCRFRNIPAQKWERSLRFVNHVLNECQSSCLRPRDSSAHRCEVCRLCLDFGLASCLNEPQYLA